MPAAIPLAISAGSAIYGAVKAKKEKEQQEKETYDQQVAAINKQNADAAAKAAGGGGGGGGGPNPEALAGFSEFAKTGGFSPEDLANIRARAISPVRATYANAEREVNRQRAIQGGYSPGFGVLQSRMAREQGQTAADAAENAEASIAQMVQQGRLQGLHGLASLPTGGGGGGGGGVAPTPTPLPTAPQQKGFWGNFGDYAGMAGQVALPILMNRYGGEQQQQKAPLPSRQTSMNYSTLPGFG